MSIKLSFCIPTYNRLDYLPGTIQSILDQYTADMQIVISDNCSTDGTNNWVKELIVKYPMHNIKYFCWDKNMGADLNYMKVIEIADGEYCWYLGSDDQILPGSAGLIISKLSYNYDTLLFCRINCDYYLSPKGKEITLNKKIKEKTFRFSNLEEFSYYCENAQDLSAFFSYLSTVIIKKSSWDKVTLDNSFIGTAYSHVQKILSFLLDGGILFYSSQAIVLARMGNDSFSSGDINARILLDINGYKKIAHYFFKNDSKLRHGFWNALRRTRSWHSLFLAKIYSKNKTNWKSFCSALLEVGFSKWKLMVVDKLFFFYKTLLIIYKLFPRMLRYYKSVRLSL